MNMILKNKYHFGKSKLSESIVNQLNEIGDKKLISRIERLLNSLLEDEKLFKKNYVTYGRYYMIMRKYYVNLIDSNPFPTISLTTHVKNLVVTKLKKDIFKNKYKL